MAKKTFTQHCWCVQQKALGTSMALCGILCILYQCRWLFEVTSLKQPILGLTTGCEEEAMFAVWRFIKGQPVFVNISEIPFASSYFNWLFYVIYGLVNSCILGLFNLQDEWLPTISRYISFSFQIGSLTVFIRIMNGRFWPEAWRDHGWKLLVAVMAVFHLGFELWPITTRPDAGALFFELLGLMYCLFYEKDKNRCHIILALLSFYLAWALKHSSVSVFSGFCVYLMINKRFSTLLMSVVSLTLLFAVTLLIGGDTYISSLIFSQSDMAFTVKQTLSVFSRATIKSPFMAGGILAFFVSIIMSRIEHKRMSVETTLIITVFAVSMIWATLTSAKSGSSTNYFHITQVIGAILTINYIDAKRTARLWQGRIIAFVSMALCFVQISAMMLVLIGLHGKTSLPIQQLQALKIRENVKQMGGPAFVAVNSYNLPWIQPYPPHFVLAFTYNLEREKGTEFQNGGVEGLIAKGYFKTIINPKVQSKYTMVWVSPKVLIEYGYVKAKADDDFDYWIYR